MSTSDPALPVPRARPAFPSTAWWGQPILDIGYAPRGEFLFISKESSTAEGEYKSMIFSSRFLGCPMFSLWFAVEADPDVASRSGFGPGWG